MTPTEAGFALPEDHPGVDDTAYLARRAAIAATGAAHRPGDPIPDVEYTPEEDALWTLVSAELLEKHRALACAEYLDAAARLVLPLTRVPQLREVDAARPRAHRVPHPPGPRARARPARSTERSPSAPSSRRSTSATTRSRSTHPSPTSSTRSSGTRTCSPRRCFADLYEAAGQASRRTETDAAHEFFSRVFWFTLEFGVVQEDGELRAYGAGLLSSYGEIEAFRAREIRPWDLAAMGTQTYDITLYQPVLFAAPSFGRLVDDARRLLRRLRR